MQMSLPINIWQAMAVPRRMSLHELQWNQSIKTQVVYSQVHNFWNNDKDISQHTGREKTLSRNKRKTHTRLREESLMKHPLSSKKRRTFASHCIPLRDRTLHALVRNSLVRNKLALSRPPRGKTRSMTSNRLINSLLQLQKVKSSTKDKVLRSPPVR